MMFQALGYVLETERERPASIKHREILFWGHMLTNQGSLLFLNKHLISI